ncbi:branched-chain amino acid transport protein AzlD [mine drainage metagenome]|uniref:Branched-chain amino acid transport protein AzlD n=1 Tax=mine drainage metagenome TaxID=410659 RepID=A0A1J5RJ34_9ZZZZ
MNLRETALIAGMAAVTFGIRYALYALGHRVAFPARVHRALRYVPVAVLTAITVPMVLLPDGAWDLSWRNPWLAGSLASAGVAWRWRRVLPAISAALLVYFGWRWLFG